MPSLRLKSQSPETRTFAFANSGLRPLTGLLIAVATCLVWVNVTHSQERNRYVADGAVHLGDVRQGEVVERRFQYRNPERSSLKVRIENLSHPGMKIRMPAELAAESTGWITVSWDTQTVQGETTAEVLLRFNEADYVPLSLTARVVPPIEILPYPAVFISGFRDEKTSRTLEIVNHDTAPLNIVGLSRENVELSESYSAGFTTLEPGRRYRLNVELKPAERAGRSADVMKVLTDHPRFPVIRIPVNVLIKDDVYINPESIDFGTITSQAFSP